LQSPTKIIENSDHPIAFCIW